MARITGLPAVLSVVQILQRLALPKREKPQVVLERLDAVWP